MPSTIECTGTVISKVQTDAGPVDVRKGVLGLSDDRSVLALDLSTIMWGQDEALKNPAPNITQPAAVTPIQGDAFKAVYYKQGNFIGAAGKLLRKQVFESSLFDNSNETLLALVAANDNSAWLRLAA